MSPDALIEAGLRGVNVSIDSPDRKVHDRVRGERGAWKKIDAGREVSAQVRAQGQSHAFDSTPSSAARTTPVWGRCLISRTTSAQTPST